MAVTAACAAVATGCADQPPSQRESIEERLAQEMTARLDGLEVTRVACVALSRERSRCSAQGTGPEGQFRLPVTVEDRAGERVWLVSEEDLAAIRRGDPVEQLDVGEAIAVVGDGGMRVRIRVLDLIDPLEVTYPEVPPRYGYRYVGVRMRLANTGDAPYADSLGAQSSLLLADGRLVARAPLTEGECAADALAVVRLEPGESLEGCVAFEVPEEARVERVTVQLGFNENLVEWRVGEAAGGGQE